MIIDLDKIELHRRINGLALKTHYTREYCERLYFDTDLRVYVVILPEQPGSKYSGKVLVPECNVACAQVSSSSVPKHQPLGTPSNRDTPSGRRKRGSMELAKATINERADARTAERIADAPLSAQKEE